MVDIDSNQRIYLSEADRKAKYLAVYSSILGYPFNVYSDHKRPRHKTLVGYALLMVGDYVYQEVPIDFDGKLLYLYENREAQVQANLVCNIAGVLRSIENLGNALGFASAYIEPKNLLQHMCPVDSIWFQVFAGTLLRVGVKTLPLDQCNDVLPVPFQRTTPPSQGALGDNLGDKVPSVGDGSGLLVGNGILPSGGTTDPFPEDREESTQLPGSWWEIVSYSEAASTTSNLMDANPATVWTTQGACHDGGNNNGPIPGQPTNGRGLSVYRNGVFSYCAHNPAKGNTTAVNFEFRPT